MSKLRKKEKLVEIDGPNGKIKRIGKLVKVFKNTKYKYKVRVAPGIFVYLKSF